MLAWGAAPSTNADLRWCVACVAGMAISRSPNSRLVRDQYFMLLIDKDAALAALPSMLPPDVEMGKRGVYPH